jgi:arginase family enzyme
MPRHRPAASLASPRFTGVRTFVRLPHVQATADVDLVVVGLPFDTGATFKVGARFGPESLRSASVMLLSKSYTASRRLPASPSEYRACRVHSHRGRADNHKATLLVELERMTAQVADVPNVRPDIRVEDVGIGFKPLIPDRECAL